MKDVFFDQNKTKSHEGAHCISIHTSNDGQFNQTRHWSPLSREHTHETGRSLSYVTTSFENKATINKTFVVNFSGQPCE